MDDIRIERQDYREFLASVPGGSVDLILTDPPYGVSRATNFETMGDPRFRVSMEFGDWDSVPPNYDEMAKAFHRTLRKGGTAIVFLGSWFVSHCHDAFMANGFKTPRLIIWEKTNPVPLNPRVNYLTNSREVAVLIVKDGAASTFHGDYDNGVYNLPIPRHGGNRQHPTQKPLDLFQELVKKHSNLNDLVVDPFLGSGTTALAASSTGRQFAGCDISEEYVAIAKSRVQDGGLL